MPISFVPEKESVMNTLLSEIAYYVKARRQSAELTQKQLADFAGVSERLIRSIEAGQAQGISLDKLQSVLSCLGLGLELSGTRDNRSESNVSSDTDYAEYEALLLKAVNSWSSKDAVHE